MTVTDRGMDYKDFGRARAVVGRGVMVTARVTASSSVLQISSNAATSRITTANQIPGMGNEAITGWIVKISGGLAGAA